MIIIISNELGDSGGPLMSVKSKVLVGVASFIYKIGNCEDFPQAFTKIAFYREWISQTTGLNLTKCS